MVQTVAPLLDKLAARKVEVFNARFKVGDSVMYIPGVGAKPQWDRVYTDAWAEGGRHLVQLASRAMPVDTDKVYAMPVEVGHVRCPEARMPMWKAATIFVLGFASAILCGLLMAPAKADPTSTVVIECLEPGEVPSAHLEQEGPQA